MLGSMSDPGYRNEEYSSDSQRVYPAVGVREVIVNSSAMKYSEACMRHYMSSK